MTGSMVQVALAEGVNEAEEIQALLAEAGIQSQLESAVEAHPRSVEDTPQKVLVPEDSVEAALDAIESLTEPDEPTGDL